MSGRLVTVHAGPLWEMQLLQGQLEELGVPSFIPDETTKAVDPFITGGNPLATNLQVPEEYADRAMALIERNRRVAEQQEPPADATPLDTALARQGRLGRRIRWAAIAWFTAPLALVMGVVYLARLERGRPRPEGHGFTLAAIVLAIPLTLVLVVVFGSLVGLELPLTEHVL